MLQTMMMTHTNAFVKQDLLGTIAKQVSKSNLRYLLLSLELYFTTSVHFEMTSLWFQMEDNDEAVYKTIFIKENSKIPSWIWDLKETEMCSISKEKKVLNQLQFDLSISESTVKYYKFRLKSERKRKIKKRKRKSKSISPSLHPVKILIFSAITELLYLAF